MMYVIQCHYCGYDNYFDIEEDTGRLYCPYCGTYLDGDEYEE